MSIQSERGFKGPMRYILTSCLANEGRGSVRIIPSPFNIEILKRLFHLILRALSNSYICVENSEKEMGVSAPFPLSLMTRPQSSLLDLLEARRV